MNGVRRALLGFGVVAACRGTPAPAPPFPAPIVVEPVAGPAITVSMHEVAPIAPPITRVATVELPPPAILPPPPAIFPPPPIIDPPTIDDSLEPIEHDDGPVVADGVDERDDRLGVDGLAQPAHGHPHAYGIAFDVGLPDGATAALVVHPRRTLAVSAGLSYNGISYGGRAGITWTPLSGTISPTLSADLGHYTDGNANPLVQLVTGNPMTSPVLDRIGYDYANAHVGLAITRRTFALFVRAGVSRITGAVHDLEALAGGKMVTFGSDPTVTLTTVSARLGVILYFGK